MNYSTSGSGVRRSGEGLFERCVLEVLRFRDSFGCQFAVDSAGGGSDRYVLLQQVEAAGGESEDVGERGGGEGFGGGARDGAGHVDTQ